MNKLTITVLLLAMSTSSIAKVTSPLFGKPVKVNGTTVEQISTATTEPASDEGIEDECPSCGFDNEALLSMDPKDIANMFKIDEDKAKAVQVFWKELPKEISNERSHTTVINSTNGKYTYDSDENILNYGVWTHEKGKDTYHFECVQQKARLVEENKTVDFSPICAFYNGFSDN